MSIYWYIGGRSTVSHRNWVRRGVHARQRCASTLRSGAVRQHHERQRTQLGQYNVHCMNELSVSAICGREWHPRGCQLVVVS